MLKHLFTKKVLYVLYDLPPMGKWIQLYSTVLFSTSSLFAQEKQLTIKSAFLHTTTSVQIAQVGVADSTSSIYYFTDGGKLISAGYLERLRELHKAQKIPASYFVFVSSLDERDKTDKRNTYFFCNPDYLAFFEKEVLPQTERAIGKKFSQSQRGLIGISFGGLNAAWFSAKSRAFANYALLSPITYPCPDLFSAITFSSHTELNIFVSTGTNDAENYAQPLYNIYKSKEVNLQYKKPRVVTILKIGSGSLKTF